MPGEILKPTMETTLTSASGAPSKFLAAFDRFDASIRAKAPGWLQAIHKGGIAYFAELGFPAADHEEWRFINLDPIRRLDFSLAEPPAALTREALAPFLISGVEGPRLIFLDGVFQPALSNGVSQSGPLVVQSLGEAWRAAPAPLKQHLARVARYDENGFTALNTAFLSDGALILASPGHEEPSPIHILHLSSAAKAGASTQPRSLIIAQKGARIRVVEAYATLGGEAVFTNAVTEVVLEQDAFVEHCKTQEENHQALHIATIQSQQARSSHFLSHSISLGALLARNTITCSLDGERAEATLNGLYLGQDRQTVDHHTAIHHNQPNCPSHEFYHGILDDRSQAVFNGKIFVRPEAQKTDAKQTNRNLLLSPDASINTKPQLEIFADDVRCTHGATIGQLNEDQIFYLRARGIGRETARKMLVHAFASEIVNRVSIPELRGRLDAELFRRYEN